MKNKLCLLIITSFFMWAGQVRAVEYPDIIDNATGVMSMASMVKVLDALALGHDVKSFDGQRFSFKFHNVTGADSVISTWRIMSKYIFKRYGKNAKKGGRPLRELIYVKMAMMLTWFGLNSFFTDPVNDRAKLTAALAIPDVKAIRKCIKSLNLGLNPLLEIPADIPILAANVQGGTFSVIASQKTVSRKATKSEYTLVLDNANINFILRPKK